MGRWSTADTSGYVRIGVRNSWLPDPYLLLLVFPPAFTAIAFAQLSLVEMERLRLIYFVPVAELALCLAAGAWALGRYRPDYDRLLLPLIGMLVGLGLAEVARLAPASFLARQMIWLGLGTLGLLGVALIPGDLRWLRRYRLVVGVNPSGSGARLWLGARGIYFQPSELLKLLLLVFLASYLEDRRETLLAVAARVGRWRVPHPAYLGPMLLMWGFSIMLLIWQRDLGAALLFFAVFLAMLYVATGQGGYILTGLLLLVAATLIGYRLFDHVALRVDAWLNPWQDASGRSFQIVQSLLAFASGGLLGQGLGQGLPTAIPVVHTDFVFAAIGEEFGLLGTLAIVVGFVLLVGRAFHIALGARRSFDQLLAAGIGAVFGLQSLVIMAGTLKLIPLTGVTLPFVSYGGSSLLTSMIMVGLLVHISGRSQ
jgi:cell division protein FtsW (lipid II flippase)